jgi:hypothetical protein
MAHESTVRENASQKQPASMLIPLDQTDTNPVISRVSLSGIPVESPNSCNTKIKTCLIDDIIPVITRYRWNDVPQDIVQ